MPITIAPTQFVSPQANQNYFQAMLQKQQLEAEMEMQQQRQLHQSIQQGISNITSPLQQAVFENYRQKQANQRFDQQQKAIGDRKNNSIAAQIGVTPNELSYFNENGRWSPEAQARMNQQNAAKYQAEMRDYQQKQQIKQQQEMQAKEMDRIAEFSHSGKDPVFTAEYNRLINQEMAILGDAQFDYQDSGWRQSKLSEIQQKKIGLGQKIPKAPTPDEMLAKESAPVEKIPGGQWLIDNGFAEPGVSVRVFRGRNGSLEVQGPGGIDLFDLYKFRKEQEFKLSQEKSKAEIAASKNDPQKAIDDSVQEDVKELNYFRGIADKKMADALNDEFPKIGDIQTDIPADRKPGSTTYNVNRDQLARRMQRDSGIEKELIENTITGKGDKNLVVYATLFSDQINGRELTDEEMDDMKTIRRFLLSRPDTAAKLSQIEKQVKQESLSDLANF